MKKAGYIKKFAPLGIITPYETQSVDMKNVQKTLQKIRKLEREIAYAPPKRAAKITVKIVRLKSSVFDKR